MLPFGQVLFGGGEDAVHQVVDEFEAVADRFQRLALGGAFDDQTPDVVGVAGAVLAVARHLHSRRHRRQLRTFSVLFFFFVFLRRRLSWVRLG